MKRSGDVTVAAIILLVISGGMLLFVGYALLEAGLGRVDHEGAVVVAMIVVYVAALGGWGTATGIGLLRLRPWARISIIVFSVLVIVGPFLIIGGLLSALFDRSGPWLITVAPVTIFAAAVSVAIAIWWIILFTRKRVALQFALPARGTEADKR